MSTNHRLPNPDLAISRTILYFSLGLALVLILVLFPVFPDHLPVSQGQIADETLRSPTNVSFTSEVLTQQKRDEAIASVQPIVKYDEDTARAQLAALSNVTSRITQIRDDPNMTPAQKGRDLSNLGNAALSAQGVLAALNLTNPEWQSVSQEANRLLQQILGQRLTATSLAELSNDLRGQVQAPLSEDGLLLLEELVRPLLIPNLIIDEAATQRAREAAAAAINQETIDLISGQVIVNKGETVDAFDIEALRAAGVFESGLQVDVFFSVFFIAIVASSLLGLYLYIFKPKEALTPKRLLLLALVVGSWILISRFYLAAVLPDNDRLFLAYLLPIAASPMVVTALLSAPLAIAVAVALALLTPYSGFYAPDVYSGAAGTPAIALQMATVYLVSSLMGVYFIHRAHSLQRYLVAAAAIAVMGFVTLLAFWLPDANREAMDIPRMIFATAIGGGLSSALALSGAILTAYIFGITTRVQLMELSQLNHPLLERLQREAPGTFHHSMVVGTLAERAAALVGADSLLVQVGAYYHDIGKLAQPQFYIENLEGGTNPHDSLDPRDSARKIIEHVRNGLTLGRAHGLPAAVLRFVPEHHGTRPVTYFYRKAQEQKRSVNAALFTYEGPKPQTRETAIVMLADSTEAVVRSSDNRSPEQIGILVDKVIAERLAEGQLDECDLTIRDLRVIAESFKASLRAIYHQRIQYPSPTEAEERQTEAAARLLRVPPEPMDGTAPPP